MLLLRFFHMENELFVGDKMYRATCPVRNEINHRRKSNQVVKTYPSIVGADRMPYYPRKIPTGVWIIKKPVFTDDPEYAPVKIPTNAVREVLTWDMNSGQYNKIVGTQEDAFYHLHFSKQWRTTLGCIRFDSAQDAIDIAETVNESFKKGEKVYIEVMVFKGE